MQLNKAASYQKYVFLFFLIVLLTKSVQAHDSLLGTPVKKQAGIVNLKEPRDSSSSKAAEIPIRDKIFKPSHTPITNLIFYATGRFPELRVSGTGAGTEGSSIATIRGYRYFYRDNQPLYVIDGVPITNFGHNTMEPEDRSDNDFGDGIGDFNPDDIESIEVLSGPEAVSRFGPRGINGVILVNSRSNYKKNGIGVEFNTGLVTEQVTHFPGFQNYYATGFYDTDLLGQFVDLNGTTYETLEPESSISWGPPLDGRRTVIDPFVYPADKNSKLLTLKPQPSDNVNSFYQKGMYFSNTLAITGSEKKTTFRFSISDRNYKGIVPGYTVKRQAISFKSNSNPFSFLHTGLALNYIHTQGNNRPNMGDNVENPGFVFATMARYVPLNWMEEYYRNTGEAGVWPGIGYNPYYIVNKLKNKDDKDRIIGSMTLNTRIFNWLSFGAEWGIDSYIQNWKKQWPVGALNLMSDENYLGRVIVQKNTIRDLNSAAHLDFKYILPRDIKLTSSLGASMLKQHRDFNNTDGRELIDEDIYELSNCLKQYNSYLKGDYWLKSLTFQGGVSIKSTLNFSFTGMNYQTSELNDDSHIITTISSGFEFTRLFKNLSSSFLSYGNIRISWSAAEDNNNLVSLSDAPVSGVKTNPEKNYGSSKSWETGFDLTFFNNRMRTDFTYYFTRIKNQTVPLSLSPATGYSSKLVNMGSNYNKGIELAVNVAAIQNNTGLNWDINLNIARNYSKIEDLYGQVTSLQWFSPSPYGVQVNIVKGEPYGSILTKKYKRSPEGEKIVKSNGAYAFETTPSVVGKICPDWIGSINNALSYKRWNVSFMIDFVQGNQLFSETKSLMNEYGTGSWTIEGRRVKDVDDQGNQLPLIGVLPGVVEIADPDGNGVIYEPNTKAVDGFTYWGRRQGEEFIMDASFIRLQEFEISYKINLQKNKLTMPLRISLIGRNLFTLDHNMGKLGSSSESVHSTAAYEQGIQVLSLPPVRTLGISLEISL